ncbi:tetratricopeptide repeat-containing sulfotransferase family protein [Parasedimentitalea psychrophila]|uniref:Sulfotransferase n=1 Tax=Parasedimentitalea psychrophila TaxID=2997337 RepID=A0A9Y2KWJ5_9RHOB|nr:tetratricopeptide repeat-containing sulfotransferase family protein [Parasedimentitalea psychrophila]WIY23620.1 sulfotransferase [Parasedimentitalea psychrophila]
MTLFTDLQATLALTQQERYKAALKSARAGMRRHKKHPDFPNFAAVALCSLGKKREAIPLYQKALALDPQFHKARRNLGMALVDIDQDEKAIKVLTKAVKNDPKDERSWMHLALAKRNLGDFEGAMEAVAKVLAISPQKEDALMLNADILDKADHISAALDAGRKALKIVPSNMVLLKLTAKLLSAQGMTDEALSLRHQAVALNPQRTDTLKALATQLLNLGRQEECRQVSLNVLKLDPTSFGSMEQLSLFQTKEQNAELRETLLSALAATKPQGPGRTSILFALAHIDRRAGETSSADGYYAQANRETALLTPYDGDQQALLTNNIISRYPGPMISESQTFPDPRPIYVVGLPRSGTTLTEVTLGAHPDVTPLGERKISKALATAFLNDLPLGPNELKELVDRQQENLPPLPADTRAYVDKMPENYRYIGVLKSAFGNARFINLRRDPRDVALSQWHGHFEKGAITYSYDLKAMAHQFNLYAEIMAHWHKVMPGEILDLSYEDLVSDIETSTKNIAEHCGLDWTPSMAQPHKHAGQVRTMSLHQVRQPVHSRSVRKWVKYEEMLAPFVAELDPNLWPEIR